MTHWRETWSIINAVRGNIFVTALGPDIIAGRLEIGGEGSVLRLKQSDEKGIS